MTESKEKSGGTLATRVVSALLLAPLILLAIVYGKAPYGLLIMAMGGIAVWEWIRMISADAPKPMLWLAVTIVCLVVYMTHRAELGLVFLDMIFLSGFFYLLAKFPFHRKEPGRIFWGLVYIATAAILLVWLRRFDEGGLFAILLLFFLVWATDIMAYFSGRLIGGPKLAPTISPKKTWAGLIGGMIGAAIVGVVYTSAARESADWSVLWSFSVMSLHGIMLIGFVIAIVGQIGDLLISKYKRHYGLKDTGYIIPGHGGVLDRIDGLLLAVPVFAILVGLLEGTDRLENGLILSWL